MGEFDDRSERLIGTLIPEAQPWAREFLRRARATGVDARIISGHRTYREQDALYAKGRRGIAGESIVTNARGGFSNHNFGIAWDIGVFKSGKYLGASKSYNELGPVGRSLGLEWGGDWKSFKDTPHYQIKTGLTLSQLRGVVARNGKIPVPKLPGAGQPAPDPTPTPEPTPTPTTHGVEVLLNGKAVAVPAMLIDSRTWIGVRGFCDMLGGSIVSASGDPLKAKVSINGEERTFTGKNIGGVGFVKFADINDMMGFGFVFDSVKRQLKLTSKPS